MPYSPAKPGERNTAEIGTDFNIRTTRPDFKPRGLGVVKSHLRIAAENLEVGEWIEVENAQASAVSGAAAGARSATGRNIVSRLGVNGKRYIGRLPDESTNGS